MAARPLVPTDLASLQAEMRRILPSLGPKRSQTFRDVRAENQARFDAAMQSRQRPTRTS
jgi:hypothetical protein